MKLVLAIVSKDDAPTVISEMMRASFSATKLSSSGGFLHRGNVTLMTGIEDERLDELIELLGKYCHRRKESLPVPPLPGDTYLFTSAPTVTVGGATIFVLNIEDFEKL